MNRGIEAKSSKALDTCFGNGFPMTMMGRCVLLTAPFDRDRADGTLSIIIHDDEISEKLVVQLSVECCFHPVFRSELHFADPKSRRVKITHTARTTEIGGIVVNYGRTKLRT